MTEPRLTSSVLVGALIRRAEAEGGFAAVLAKGDPTSGSILVMLTERGAPPRIYERILQPDGRYGWQEAVVAEESGSSSLQDFIARRRRFDPDLWLIELDIPSAERFAAELTAFG
ncbi:MAG TPA: DUF1491 family protein [Allosphingosinicella sp.]